MYNNLTPWPRPANPYAPPEIGLHKKEIETYSFTKTIMALHSGDWSRAGLERECSDATAKLLGRAARGAFVPMDVMNRGLNATTDAQGGHLVGNDLRPQDFISLIRARLIVRELGATILAGLVGNVSIPGGLSGSTAYWLSENENIPAESVQTFKQVGLAPKSVGAYTDISRKLLLQSSLDIEQYVREEIATTIAHEIDRAAINGSGSDPEPRGILNVVGIGAVAGGTNGKAPTHQNIVALESEVALDNADIGRLAYLTNSKVRGKLRTTFKNASYGQTPIWETDPQARPGRGMLNGYPALCSNVVPSDLSKGSAAGVCSAVIFGDWSSLLIGQWGTLDILVDRVTKGLMGGIRVICFQDVDIAVKNAVSFSSMQDALTT